MIKLSFLMISAIVLFISGTSINSVEKINIIQNFPAVIKAGDDFIVSLKIQKSTINGFARLQQDLPAGFIAEEIENGGADFIFEDQKIKFIWVKFPNENDFIITYKIRTDKNTSGNKIINGEFVFMENGKTQKQQLSTVNVSIKENLSASLSNPQVTRRLLTIAPEKGEYRVELIVYPNETNEAARFTDDIPENFTAELIEAHGAEFSFENQSVVFNWKKLPSERSFMIAYSVKSGKTGNAPVINGVFLLGEINKELPTQNKDPYNKDFLNASAVKATDANINPSHSPLTDTKKVISEKKILPAAEKGITYKVQISATQKSSVKTSSWFNSKYLINSDVELTYQEGWKKYLIGSFHAYNDASNFKKHTQEKIPDAFVVAYENGMRISVRDALKNKSFNQ